MSRPRGGKWTRDKENSERGGRNDNITPKGSDPAPVHAIDGDRHILISAPD